MKNKILAVEKYNFLSFCSFNKRVYGIKRVNNMIIKKNLFYNDINIFLKKI